MLFKDAVAIALKEMAVELSPTALPTWRSHARSALRYWGEERDLTTLTRADIQAWITWRAQTVKASTVGHERCFLSRLWRIVEDLGLDAGLQNPFQRLRMPRKQTDRRKISDGVINQLAQRMKPADWDLVLLTLLTMLRRLEVFRLEPAHIVADTPDEHGRPRWKVFVITSKTGRSRFVPLNAAASEIALRRAAECQRLGHTYLFGGQRENRYSAACYWSRHVWRPLIKAIGEGGEFHGLRHRGAHRAWKGNAPIEAISKMLGHSNLVQTQHYLGITDETAWLAADAVAITDPPPMPRPGLVDPAPTNPPPTPPLVLPDPEPERVRTRATDWIFTL